MGTKLPSPSCGRCAAIPLRNTARSSALSFHDLRAMSITKHREKQDILPQPGIRTWRGCQPSSLPCVHPRNPIRPQENRSFGRESHGFARKFESLRRLRLPLVSCPV